MRWTNYYLHTTREVPNDAEVISHQLMVRAGMIKKVAAGIYSYLPFGWRSLRKLEAIVRRELDRAGSVELLMPAVQPVELWDESGRSQVYGKELLRIDDRHGRGFCFGPTHEEVITDIVRKDVRSYRQLPINLYQIQTKFRDEIRPRFGLMRGREFLMKDAYSFHTDYDSLDLTYAEMRDAYRRILDACGLDHVMVEADSGAIGGASSHEFMVVADTGESAIVRCPACDYGANVEKAETRAQTVSADEDFQELGEVATPNCTAVEEVARLMGIGAGDMVKTLLYEVDDVEGGEGAEPSLIAIAIRGDREVNEIKLANYLGVPEVRLASEEKVEAATGAPVGFAGPVGLGDGVRLIGDLSAKSLANFVCGANAADKHLSGVNWQRDVQLEEWVDVLLVVAGDDCPRCEGSLELYRGIEVGHIFQLGTKYSEKMKCEYLDDNGKAQPMVMGCYGMGIGRTVAAAIEQNHDADGISWPLPLAPFEVLVAGLDPKDEDVVATADRLYEELREKGVDVLYDDRAERPGVKFKDADLIGIPVRVVVGKKSLANGKIELSLRSDRERQDVSVTDAVVRVLDILLDGRSS